METIPGVSIAARRREFAMHNHRVIWHISKSIRNKIMVQVHCRILGI